MTATLEAMKRRVASKSNKKTRPQDLILGTEAFDAFIANKEVREAAPSFVRGPDTSVQLTPGAQTDETAVFKGRYGDMNIWIHEGKYLFVRADLSDVPGVAKDQAACCPPYACSIFSASRIFLLQSPQDGADNLQFLCARIRVKGHPYRVNSCRQRSRHAAEGHRRRHRMRGHGLAIEGLGCCRQELGCFNRGDSGSVVAHAGIEACGLGLAIRAGRPVMVHHAGNDDHIHAVSASFQLHHSRQKMVTSHWILQRDDAVIDADFQSPAVSRVINIAYRSIGNPKLEKIDFWVLRHLLLQLGDLHLLDGHDLVVGECGKGHEQQATEKSGSNHIDILFKAVVIESFFHLACLRQGRLKDIAVGECCCPFLFIDTGLQ